jgi:hypothetical protein
MMVALGIGILNVLGLFFIAWWCWKKDSSAIKNFYWPALIFKVACGVLLGLLYTYYYTANDTFYFFDAAVALSNKGQTDFYGYINSLIEPDPRYFSGEARSLFFIKVVSVVALLTHGNYWIASIYFSLLTFYSTWYVTTLVVKNIPSIRIAAVMAFLFFPSAVFWSAGIIKESLAMAALFFLTGVIIKLWCKQRVSLITYLVSAIAIWVTWNLKYYYIGLFLPIVITALLVKWVAPILKVKHFSVELILFLLLLGIGLGAASFIHPNFNLSVIAEVLVTNNEAFMKVSSYEDVIHYADLHASVSSLLLNSPWALISGLYRPFIWEATSITQAVAACENILLLILTGIALVRWQQVKQSDFRILVLAVVVYSVMLCIFLALSSPNFGTLARYKVGFLPFLVLALSANPVIEKVYQRIFYFGK